MRKVALTLGLSFGAIFVLSQGVFAEDTPTVSDQETTDPSVYRDFRAGPQEKVDDKGRSWYLNPLDDSESWYMDSSRDEEFLSSVRANHKSLDQSPTVDEARVLELAQQVGSYPDLKVLSGSSHLLDFTGPPRLISVEAKQDKRQDVLDQLTSNAISYIAPIAKALCVDEKLSFVGFSKIDPTQQRAQSVLFPHYNGFRIWDEALNTNWALGSNNRWYVVNAAVFTPCQKRTYEPISIGLLDKINLEEKLNTEAEVSISSLLGYAVESVQLLTGQDAVWSCFDDYCVLTHAHSAVLPGKIVNQDYLSRICRYGSQTPPNEDVLLIAYIAHQDSSLVSCHFEPYMGGKSNGTIRVDYAEPYSTTLVQANAWYGTIYNFLTDQISDALNINGAYDNGPSLLAYYIPSPDPTTHGNHNFHKSTYSVPANSSNLPSGDWKFPPFGPGEPNLYSLADTSLDQYDRSRLLAEIWAEWAIQVQLDTVKDIKYGLDVNGNPNRAFGIGMCNNCGSKVKNPYTSDDYSVVYDAPAISPTSAENGDSLSIGAILHEFQHTPVINWAQNLNGVQYSDAMNECSADTYTALLTKGQNFSGGDYTGFNLIAEYSKYPGGTSSDSENVRLGHLLSATNYQLNVLGYQVGWDGLLYGMFFPNTSYKTDYAITGWARTGGLQAAFSTVTPVRGKAQKTFADFAIDNLIANGFTGYDSMVNNHFNRTATTSFEVPIYDKDGIGNKKRWSQFLIWPDNYESGISVSKDPEGSIDLKLTKGAGSYEDYDYYQFFAPLGVSFNIEANFPTSLIDPIQMSLHDENGNCLVGPNCSIVPVKCGTTKWCISNWESPSSQMYYFRLVNTYNEQIFEISVPYQLTLTRNDDKEGDTAQGAEPTYINNTKYLTARLDSSLDEDYFRVVIPGQGSSLIAYTCAAGADTPNINLTLYNSQYSNPPDGYYVANQVIATSSPYPACGNNHARVNYAGSLSAGVYFLKASYRGSGQSSGKYRLYVNVLDATLPTKTVDEDSVLTLQLERMTTNSSGKYFFLRGYLSGTSDTAATTYCTRAYPQTGVASSPCPDQVDFYRVYVPEGRYLNVGSRGGVELSVWAVNTIHDARREGPTGHWGRCPDAEGVGCAPLVVDKLYAIDDSPTSGELTFVAPISDYYDVRVVNNSNASTHYTLFMHLQANIPATTTAKLNYPATYAR